MKTTGERNENFISYVRCYLWLLHNAKLMNNEIKRKKNLRYSLLVKKARNQK